MSVGIQMPQYRCHKTVSALKIKEVVCHAHPDPAVSIEEFAKTDEFSGCNLFFEDERYAFRPMGAIWFRKHQPTKGGYFVVYEDGYESFSPAKAFEDGYTKI